MGEFLIRGILNLTLSPRRGEGTRWLAMLCVFQVQGFSARIFLPGKSLLLEGRGSRDRPSSLFPRQLAWRRRRAEDCPPYQVWIMGGEQVGMEQGLSMMGWFICGRKTHHFERRPASAAEGYRTPRRVAPPDGLWQNGGRGDPELGLKEGEKSARKDFRRLLFFGKKLPSRV